MTACEPRFTARAGAKVTFRTPVSGIRRATTALALLAAAAGVGCAPLPAPYFGETSETLKAGGVAISAIGAAGLQGNAPIKLTESNGVVGLGGKLRVGVGAKQEVSFDVAGGWLRSLDFGKPSETQTLWGGRLGWKGAPATWVAFLAGVNMSRYLDYGIGGDLGLVIGPKIPIVPLRVYFGGRVGLMGPFDSDAFVKTGLSLSGVVPAGLSIELPLVRIFIEGGYVGSRNWIRNSMDARVVDEATFHGGYAAIGLALVFGKTY